MESNTFNEMLEQMKHGQGFIAALDQSGGSTPKALANYGISAINYTGEAEMFRLIHRMRTRVITSPAFTNQYIIGAILFERTMDGRIEGRAFPKGRRWTGDAVRRCSADEADPRAGSSP